MAYHPYNFVGEVLLHPVYNVNIVPIDIKVKTYINEIKLMQ